jgi:hypothetical protein
MIKFKYVTDIAECRRLWEKFSPKESVWDLWEVVYSFHKYFSSGPLFIVGLDSGDEVGLLPLEKDVYGGKECYTFFGGDYPERRTFYVKDKKLIRLFLAKAPEVICLNCIDPAEKDFLPDIKEGEINYSLELEKYNRNIEEYFSTFNKKHKKNLKYDLRQLEKEEYKICWNIKSHLGRLAELNRLRFGQDSDFTEERFCRSMELLIDSAEKFGILQLLSIEIKGKVEASELALFYNGTYYIITGGYNPEISNLGKLLIAEHIKKAMSLNAKLIDFLSTDSGWKRLWNFKETRMYDYER